LSPVEEAHIYAELSRVLANEQEELWQSGNTSAIATYSDVDAPASPWLEYSVELEEPEHLAGIEQAKFPDAVTLFSSIRSRSGADSRRPVVGRQKAASF